MKWVLLIPFTLEETKTQRSKAIYLPKDTAHYWQSQVSHLLQDGVQTSMSLLWTCLWCFSQIYLQVIFLEQRKGAFISRLSSDTLPKERSLFPRGSALIQNPTEMVFSRETRESSTRLGEQAWGAVVSPKSWVTVWQLLFSPATNTHP